MFNSEMGGFRPPEEEPKKFDLNEAAAEETRRLERFGAGKAGRVKRALQTVTLGLLMAGTVWQGAELVKNAQEMYAKSERPVAAEVAGGEIQESQEVQFLSASAMDAMGKIYNSADGSDVEDIIDSYADKAAEASGSAFNQDSEGAKRAALDDLSRASTELAHKLFGGSGISAEEEMNKLNEVISQRPGLQKFMEVVRGR